MRICHNVVLCHSTRADLNQVLYVHMSRVQGPSSIIIGMLMFAYIALECIIWTFLKGTTDQLPSECRMKARFPADVTLENAFEAITNSRVVITGYVKSRVTSSEIEVLELSKLLHQRQRECL